MIFFFLPLFGAIKSESYPRKLTDEEERLYLERLAKYKDPEARNKLIEHNLRLVAHIAKKYENTGEDKDDMRKAGIEYAADQIRDLRAHGVDGVHIYSMNKVKTTTDICNML